MRRKQVREYKKFPSVVLYQEDLQELIEIFKGNTSSFTISDNEFEYDNIEELKAKRGPKVKLLFIESETPLLEFQIGWGRTKLMHGGNVISVPGFNEISRLLRTTRRRLLYLAFNRYTAIASMVLLLPILYMFPPPWRHYVMFPLTVLVAVFFILGFNNQAGAFSRIILLSRYDEQSFYARNKDTIWVGVIVAVVTSFVTWLITYLTTK
jgi:hypothetical protein